MIRTRLICAMALASCAALAACGPSVQERCQGAKDPVTCAAVAQSGGDVQDYLLGGLAGAAISGAMTGGRHPTVVKHYHRPDYQSIPTDKHQRTTVTTTKRSLFGGHTVTRSTTWSSRSSYSAGTRTRRR